MKGIFSSKIAVGVLFAVCVGAFTAQAELLLYDGFATATDGQSRTPYMSSSDTHKLQSDNAKGEAWTTGVSKNYPWSEQSGVVFTFRNEGLSLPADFTKGTGEQFSARGGSLGYSNSSAPDTDLRAKNRAITSTMPTSGKLYYRCLMKIDSTTLTSLKTTSWRYYRTGISATPAANAYDNQADLKNNGLQIGFTSPGASPQRVDIGVNIGGQYTSVLQNISAGTNYIGIVELDYDAGTANVYVSPIADYSKTFAWTVENLAVASAVTASAMKVMFIDGSYKTNGGKVMFDEIAVGTKLTDVAVVTPSTTPQLGAVSLTRSGAATYAVSAEVLENAADTVSWIADAGTAATTNAFATAVATNTTASGTVSGLTADKTYQISVLAENAANAASKIAGVVYSGELALGNVTNAYEYNCVPGGVEVSRASADPWPLTVNYTISGSAGTGGTTWVNPVAVTIPAGAMTAFLPVVPLMDGDVTEDITITVTLAAGNYEISAAASATLALVNLSPPVGKKTWIAAADGLASDGANWTPTGAPASSDKILFDGNFSNARCTWDAPATHAVASWEQTAAFTGTVELQTTYDLGAFPELAIAGDCAISGGTLTQTKNEDAQVYRLSLSVGGDLSVASGGQITATGKGYDACHYPIGSACGIHGGSANDLSLVYGDLKHPVDIGSAGSTSGFKGGGAIHLVVTGDATIDGTLAAQPSTGSTESDTRYKGHGAGGSIYITAASVAGSGSITAAGYGFSSSWQRPGGAGGRIAVVCTTAESLAFPTANLMCNGSVASYGNTTGAGTIFVKTASQQNGTLIVDNAFAGANFEAFWPTKRGVTPIPAGETWTLDEIQFRRYGVLCVPEGTTLAVPLSGVSSASDRTAGILYEGGTLNIGSAPYTLTGKWTFQADAPFTFDGDVTVAGGANIGGLRFSGNYLNDFAQCDVTVDGDLTIASDGYASATMAGPCEANKDGGPYPRHGGQYASLSGNRCYGSVFAPVLPGYFAQAGDHATAGIGGGVLKLTVTGDLVVEGSVTANSAVFSKSSAAAGSVSITAKTLSGNGSITANGAVGSIQWDNGYNGVGGRIAVRVTGEDVGTTGVWTKFAARGCATNQVATTNERNQNSSAGTIYLQGKSDGEKGGTIYVKNQASYDTSNVATWIPAATRGDGAKDFAKAKLVIADRGVVAVGTNRLAVASVSIATNSTVNLAGNVLTVRKAYLNGVSLGAGEYTADNSAVTGYVVDSVGGGKLIVGGGFFVVVR